MPEVDPNRRWFPVCRGEEAIARHIVHTALLGQELAVWRAGDGTVNAWENRCPHRGVRLTAGTNLGNALKCRYHGWTFESGSGQCIERPAHPGQKPPALARARVFPCVEACGYVWVRLEGGAEGDGDPPLEPAQPVLTFRSVHVRANAAVVAETLASRAREAPDKSTVDVVDPYTVHTTDSGARTTRYLLQPVTETETVIHAALDGTPPPARPLAVLRRENDWLRVVRDAIEAHASS